MSVRDRVRVSFQTRLPGRVFNIDIQEVNRARAQYRAGLLMSQESAASRAGQIARQMLLYGRPVPNEELLDRLSLITPERLTDLSGRMFLDSKPTIAAVGPVGQMMSYDGIRDSLNSYAAQKRPAKLAV